jgi:hypothetical protein
MFLWISVYNSCQKIAIWKPKGADSLMEVERHRFAAKGLELALPEVHFAPLTNGCGTKSGISGAAHACAKRVTQNGRSQARSELHFGSAATLS